MDLVTALQDFVGHRVEVTFLCTDGRTYATLREVGDDHLRCVGEKYIPMSAVASVRHANKQVDGLMACQCEKATE